MSHLAVALDQNPLFLGTATPLLIPVILRCPLCPTLNFIDLSKMIPLVVAIEAKTVELVCEIRAREKEI